MDGSVVSVAVGIAVGTGVGTKSVATVGMGVAVLVAGVSGVDIGVNVPLHPSTHRNVTNEIAISSVTVWHLIRKVSSRPATVVKKAYLP